MRGTDFLDIIWREVGHSYLTVRYSVYFADGTFIGDAGTNTSYRVTGLTPDTEYSFYVKSRVDYPANIGENLIKNGFFYDDTKWVKGVGWNIGGGIANNDGQVGNLVQLDVPFLNGETYHIKFTTSAAAYQGLGLRYSIGSNTFQGAVMGDGVHANNIVAGSENSEVRFIVENANDFLGSLDDVIVAKLVSEAQTVYSEPSNITTGRTRATPIP